MQKYYEIPTQVKFYDVDGDNWIGGIAYENYIICGCCGGKIEISDLVMDAEEIDMKPDMLIQELPWVNIDETIRGY